MPVPVDPTPARIAVDPESVRLPTTSVAPATWVMLAALAALLSGVLYTL